jgi:hypothetical protein
MRTSYDITFSIGGKVYDAVWHETDKDWYKTLFHLTATNGKKYTLYVLQSKTTDAIYANIARNKFWTISEIQSTDRFCAPTWLGLLADTESELANEVVKLHNNWEGAPEYQIGVMMESMLN